MTDSEPITSDDVIDIEEMGDPTLRLSSHEVDSLRAAFRGGGLEDARATCAGQHEVIEALRSLARGEVEGDPTPPVILLRKVALEQPAIPPREAPLEVVAERSGAAQVGPAFPWRTATMVAAVALAAAVASVLLANRFA